MRLLINWYGTYIQGTDHVLYHAWWSFNGHKWCAMTKNDFLGLVRLVEHTYPEAERFCWNLRNYV